MEHVAAEADALGEDHWRVRLVVQNTGWLPSYVSKRALERQGQPRGHRRDRTSCRRDARPRQAPRGPGAARGPLVEARTGVSFWPDYNVTDDRAKIEWVVRGRKGDRIDLVARHERARAVRATVVLG